jgi:SAM-dependent methyltransferase
MYNIGMNKVEEQRNSFEQRSEEYYEKRQTGNHLVLKDLIWDYFFREKSFLAKENMFVLEPMCGYGEGCQIIRKHLTSNIQYSGFDYSESLVRIAKQKDPNLNIWVQDVTKYEEKSKYDLIIIIGSLHHVPDFVQDVVNRIFAALKPGGYFVNFEPTQNNWLFKKVRQTIYKKNKTFDPNTERGFDLKEINSIYQNAGFKIIDQAYMGLASFVLYYNPNAFPKLNIGNPRSVKRLFNMDKHFFRNFFGKKLSFSTTSLLQKPE